MKSTQPETLMSEAVASYWARKTPGSRVIKACGGYLIESDQTYQTSRFVRAICYGANEKAYINLNGYWYGV